MARRILLTLGFGTLVGWVVMTLSKPYPLVEQIASVAMMIVSIASWIGAVWLWSKVPPRTPVHLLVLIFLVPLGFIWGWIYILIRAWELPAVPSAPEGLSPPDVTQSPVWSSDHREP